MSFKATVKIDGLAQLRDGLAELPKATSNNVLKRALTKAAEPIRADAERLAPKLKGGLARSIKVGTKLSKSQKSKHKKQSPVEVFVGPSGSTKSITQEFGAAHHAAQPYMRPAWDNNVGKALATVRDDIKTELDAAVARAKRKAAR